MSLKCLRNKLMLLALLTVLSTLPVPAQASDDSPIGVDIIFVVDRSGSMLKGSIRYKDDPRCTPTVREDCPRTPPTDPDDLSIDAVRNGINPIFSRLAAQEIARQEVDLLKEENRFGLVVFGSEAKTLVPLTPIETISDPTTRLLTPSVASQLDSSIQQLGRQGLGETSFSRAFDKVCSLYTSSDTCPEQFPQDRQRVIVLLTDGNPAISGEPGAIETSYSADTPNLYFDQLRQRYQKLFADPQTKIWVLGIDKQDQFWPLNASQWEQIAPGRTRKLNSPEDVNNIFQDIAEGLFSNASFKKGVCDPSQSFLVSPYLASVTLVLNKRNVDSTAAFYPPSEWAKPESQRQRLSPNSPGVVSYDKTKLSEFFIIKRPEPGEWHCTLIGAGAEPEYRVREGLFALAQVTPTAISGTGVASTCQPFSFTVTYKDIDGQPLKEDPRFPLVHHALVQLNDGRQETVSLQPSVGRTDQWETSGSIRPSPQGGTYPISITVALQNGQTIFAQQKEITISPDYPCTITVVSPQPNASLPLTRIYTPLPLNVEVDLKRSDGQPVRADVFDQPLAQTISTTITMPNGKTIPVALQASDTPGRFTAQMTNLDSAGNYNLKIGIKTTTRDGHALYTLNAPAVAFTRVVDPTRRAIEIAMLALLVAGLMLVIAGMIWFIYLVTPPYPSGTLLIQTRKKLIPGLPVFPGDEWDDIGISMSSRRLLGLRTKRPRITRELPAALNLKRLDIRSMNNKRRSGLRVIVVPRKGSPSEKRLDRDGATANLGPDTRLKYENYN